MEWEVVEKVLYIACTNTCTVLPALGTGGKRFWGMGKECLSYSLLKGVQTTKKNHYNTKLLMFSYHPSHKLFKYLWLATARKLKVESCFKQMFIVLEGIPASSWLYMLVVLFFVLFLCAMCFSIPVL